MPRAISSFSYDAKKDAALIPLLDSIAKREGKSRSELIVEALNNHVVNHQKGNNQFTLETATKPEFLALPSMGEILTVDDLVKMGEADLLTLAGACRGRVHEIDAELHRRGLQLDFKWSL